MAVRIIFISFPVFCTCTPPPPPPLGSILYLSFCFPGPSGPRAQCGGARKEGLGSILVISTKINTSLLGVRFIDPAAWVDLSLGSGAAWTKMGLGGRGEGFILLERRERCPASIQNRWIMDKGILWKTGKTLNEIQFTMAVIQMQNYWKSFGNQFWKIF